VSSARRAERRTTRAHAHSGNRRSCDPDTSHQRRDRLLDDAAHRPHLGRRGQTPVVRVRGRSRRRISIAALTCYRPGQRARLIYRPRRDDGRRDGRKSFAWTDCRDLLITAHQQLGGPIVLVWDNLNVHLAYGIRQFIDRQDWLTVYQLPSYAPDLNPVEASGRCCDAAHIRRPAVGAWSPCYGRRPHRRPPRRLSGSRPGVPELGLLDPRRTTLPAGRQAPQRPFFLSAFARPWATRRSTNAASHDSSSETITHT
jgi:hypothetical protein